MKLHINKLNVFRKEKKINNNYTVYKIRGKK
jgi:hypothetical protein